ncbi:L-lactate permease, partial [Aliarcobacter butzleri]|uniref:L-lactate permease n=1 Tax=Aliarcobacter butzleri TaxID=28197 RepID=UPI003AF944CE
PAALVAGASFAISQYLSSNFIGPELPDVTSAIVSIVATTVFLKYWKPKNVMKTVELDEVVSSSHISAQVLKAWAPLINLC